MTIDRRYSVAEGTAFKAPCRVATTANILLIGLQSIDSVTVAEHDRVLVKDQTTASENGIYEATTGNWTRTKDFDGAYDIVHGTKVYVTSGGEANTEYTVTSADPITIGTSNITFEVAFDSILVEAEAAAALATAAAAALGNQAYTFDYYSQAAAATVPVGVKSLRLMGYYTYGDAPQAHYYRVAAQPATANRIRTTDRFMPDGSTSAGNGGWWQMVLDGLTDVRKYGVIPSFGDVTTLLNGAIAAGNILIPPSISTYTLSSEVTLVSDRQIWVQPGAHLKNTGGRWTGYLVSNVHIRNDGWLEFASTADAAAKVLWSAASNRGLIEMGSDPASPTGPLSVYGMGKVSSDYVFTTVAATGLPATGAPNSAYQLNRKGIAFMFSHDVLCEGQEVYGTWGETIYYVGSSWNVKFLNNNIHDVAFDAIDFNTGTTFPSGQIAGNRCQNAYAGVEASGGKIYRNIIRNCVIGITTGAGGGAYAVDVSHNEVTTTQDTGISVAYSGALQLFNVSHNQVQAAGSHGILCSNIQGGQVCNNTVIGHGQLSAGYSVILLADAVYLRADGNVTVSPGAFSSGNFTNNAGASNSVGTNPTF